MASVLENAISHILNIKLLLVACLYFVIFSCTLFDAKLISTDHNQTMYLTCNSEFPLYLTSCLGVGFPDDTEPAVDQEVILVVIL